MAKSVREVLRLVFQACEGKSHSISCGDPKVTWRNLGGENVSHGGIR